MRNIFESKLDRGFVNLLQDEEQLFISSGLRKEAYGVTLEIPAPEAADLTEALLQHLDEATRMSVISRVLGSRHESNMENSTKSNVEMADSETTSNVASSEG